jgi:hypothetical protein
MDQTPLFTVDQVYSTPVYKQFFRTIQGKKLGILALLLIPAVAFLAYQTGMHPFVAIVLGLVASGLYLFLIDRKITSSFEKTAAIKNASVHLEFFEDHLVQTVTNLGQTTYTYAQVFKYVSDHNIMAILMGPNQGIFFETANAPAGLDDFIRSKVSKVK